MMTLHEMAETGISMLLLWHCSFNLWKDNSSKKTLKSCPACLFLGVEAIYDH